MGMEESIPKAQFAVMPIIHCKAVVMQEGKVDKGVYACPCYCTTNRNKSYVFTAQLKTKHNPAKWVLAGAPSFSMSRVSPMVSTPDRSPQKMLRRPRRSE